MHWSPIVHSFMASALLAIPAMAQKPAFTSPLLLKPARDNGKCLAAASDADLAAVTIQPCTGSTAQMWTFTAGQVQVFGNKCLDVVGGVSVNADGQKLQVRPCSDKNTNQEWSYDKRTNRLLWASTKKCLDLTDGKPTDGNQMQVWTCASRNPNQVWNAGYMADKLPQKSQEGQTGVNTCGTVDGEGSKCQTAWINSGTDFCLWGPPKKSVVGDAEAEMVAYCTQSGHGARLIPKGTLEGVHFVKTAEYVQVTGVGDFTKINIPKGDEGGELDNRGADGNGNPIGGLVYGNTFGTGTQYHEWTNFMSDREFCFRACIGPKATQLCNHVYDLMGCFWNIPASYKRNVYEDCVGDVAEPMGVYGTSTWAQGHKPTPTPHRAPSSSSCIPISTGF